MIKFLFINGPNINFIGKREPDIYGNVTYEQLVKLIEEECSKNNISSDIFQSNIEGEIIDKIQKSEDVDLIIANLGAYTHTSIAIRDAFLSVNKPFIEVHISNIFKREKFRHKSFISDIAIGVISGFGIDSYLLAIYAGKKYIIEKRGLLWI